MEESVASNVADGEIIGIQFGLATHVEICKSSINDCPISHASQLANPFLGLPLETGKCESCGTAELGQCEGHFGYIELPIPIYHPSHISELRRLLSLLCLKCLKLKTSKPSKNNGVMERLLSACCEETCHVSIKESKNNDGASFLELRLPARYRTHDGVWNFLERYGYRYGDGSSRILLPSEVSVILKKLPDETRRKLARKGYFPQDGYILRYLPVPPNCLSVPDISDGVSVMSSDLSAAMLKKVLRQIEVIRSSRSGDPNFESHEVEANELQVVVSDYLQVRGTSRAARDADNRYGVTKEGNNSSTKAWLEKMRTLFISKGSGFSSRSVITGDAYKPVNEIGLPSEIAKKMTFEERVNVHNIQYLQSLVDRNLCLTFRDGSSTYSLREGSKGHTFLRLGQVVHRRIVDGDIVFINRPPTTHKHSLQALRVYIHDDHTVKINPLMCGPLAADFDGDCVHLFYPQSLSARAEVLELFSVDKQLLSSHSGNLNLQLATDSLLSLKIMFQLYFLNKASAQQLAMYASTPLPSPALLKACSFGPRWTALQVLQTALPPQFECRGDRLLIHGSEVVKLDFNRDVMASVINEILTSLFFNKSPKEALNFFDALQPLLMENIFAEGFSVGLHDFYVPISELQTLQSQIQDISPLLVQLRSSFNELVQLQFESYIRHLKVSVANFILKSSALGNLIDSRSDSAIDKVVQQIGFLGLQLSDKRKFYSRSLVEEVACLFHQKYPYRDLYPSGEFGLVKSCFFRGLDPYEEIVHSIATREVIVRSSKGLAEPGTLFKNLMAILRDVVICYDGSVRNLSSNSIIQFEYGLGGVPSQSLFPAGEPVGVLAATAMSNPAYKAVLDSSPSSNSSWDMMKEILFCRVNFKNDLNDRRVILYLNDCDCGRRYCQENASYVVKNHLKKVSLRDAAAEFLIEYKHSKAEPGSSELDTGLVGHIHLNKTRVNEANISMLEILQKCEDEVNMLRRKKKYGFYFKRILLSVSECCYFKHSSSKWSNVPCLKFFLQDLTDIHLERTSHIMADLICPILLDTIIKGDPRISTVNIIWVNPDTTMWVESPCSDRKGELAVEVTLEKTAVRQNGDAWRIVLDCCLPVFHLIDTRRSIPYAIKQIQDLFGISCAFDQAVQRLSTSVTMVTKGVLKEHLILLASSMTCAGNLVGFNMSGIKALCRALGVQVPFTEATLYTPRKCFERASEKCHVDSLASIVASCSWGKRVSVGTGAKFDVLWDTKETGIGDQQVDVYNFLHLVRGSNDDEVDAGCLGEDTERFEWEDTSMEPALSPDQENKAVFEDTVEIGLDSHASGEVDSGWDAKGWGGKNNSENFGSGSGTTESNGWSSWGTKKDHSQPQESSGAGGWETSKVGSQQENGIESSWGQATNSKWKNSSESTDGWNSNKANEEAVPNSWDSRKADGKTQASWGQPSETASKDSIQNAGGWSTKETADETGSKSWQHGREGGKSQSSWGQSSEAPWKKSNQNAGGWSSEKSGADVASKSWEPRKEGGKTQSSWGLSSETASKDSTLNVGGWSTKVPGEETGSKSWELGKDGGKTQSSWGQPGEKAWKNSNQNAGGWGAENHGEAAASKSWEPRKEGSKTQSSWGQKSEAAWKNSNQNAGGWSTEKRSEESASKSWEPRKEGGKTQSSWGQPSEMAGGNTEKHGEWGQPSEKPWGKSTKNVGDWSANKPSEEEGSKGWSFKKDEHKTPSWGQASGTPWKNSRQTTDTWTSEKANDEAGNKSWEPRKEEANLQSSWGRPKETAWNNSNQSAGGWNTKKANEEAGSVWESKKEEGQTQSSWGQTSDTTGKNSKQSTGGWITEKANDETGSKSWDSKKEESKTPSSWGQAQSSWGRPKEAAWNNSNQSAGGWNTKKANEEAGSVWGSKKEEGQTQSSWGQTSDTTGKNSKQSTGGWSTEKANDETGSKSWDSKKEECKTPSSWGQAGALASKDTQGTDEWSSMKSNPPSSSQAWGSGKGDTDNNSEKQDTWGSSQAWGSGKGDTGDNSEKQNTWGSSQAWGSGKGDTDNSEKQDAWGQPGNSGWKKKRPEGGRGWGSSNSGEWKSRKNRPPKQPGQSNDDSAGVAFTATRKRMDLFTTEEQDALSAMESIMQSIRRIMHQPGFNDGNPLPDDDQSYIINNVLDHHPDKAAKMGAGIKYITVKKHSSFQESRCFYVVKTDDQAEDFSYIKCLENLVKTKYPSVAESFNSKYFRRQRAGPPGGNRQQE